MQCVVTSMKTSMKLNTKAMRNLSCNNVFEPVSLTSLLETAPTCFSVHNSLPMPVSKTAH